MSAKFHVITPLARFGNVADLMSMLENQNVTWHVITDDDAKETISFTQPWIKHYVCPTEGVEFWKRCNNSINWFIDTQEIIQEDFYCFMNDDDGYKPDFFDKMRSVVDNLQHEHSDHEVIICSMERGHNIPAEAVPPRRHDTSTLIAHPDKMTVGSVGVEQIFMTGRVMSKHRLALDVAGDGMMIRRIVRNYKTAYVPDLHVLFNYLEPGRWNK